MIEKNSIEYLSEIPNLKELQEVAIATGNVFSRFQESIMTEGSMLYKVWDKITDPILLKSIVPLVIFGGMSVISSVLFIWIIFKKPSPETLRMLELEEVERLKVKAMVIVHKVHMMTNSKIDSDYVERQHEVDISRTINEIMRATEELKINQIEYLVENWQKKVSEALRKGKEPAIEWEDEWESDSEIESSNAVSNSTEEKVLLNNSNGTEIEKPFEGGLLSALNNSGITKIEKSSEGGLLSALNNSGVTKIEKSSEGGLLSAVNNPNTVKTGGVFTNLPKEKKIKIIGAPDRYNNAEAGPSYKFEWEADERYDWLLNKPSTLDELRRMNLIEQPSLPVEETVNLVEPLPSLPVEETVNLVEPLPLLPVEETVNLVESLPSSESALNNEELSTLLNDLSSLANDVSSVIR